MAGRKKTETWKLDAEKLFERLETGVTNSYSPEKVAPWIEKNTFLNGKNFSFVDHEYQIKILNSKKRVQYTKKCSQLGITELKIRRVLAMSYLIPHFSTILTFPTAGFADNVCKTRLDPVISASDTLKAALDRNNNNTELKQIGSSFIHIRGTFSTNAAISTPADMLAIDEVDFSDQEILGKLQGRLTHSKHKFRMETSTPTVAKFGIDERFQESNRHYNLCKCCHCNHWFIPSYLDHVVVPGFDGDILSLGKGRLAHTRWREARLACPSCGKTPDLSPEYRQWVVENEDEQHEADGFQLSPFDAPAFITVQDLMVARCNYKRPVDFVNFSLGQCAEDELSGLQGKDFDTMKLAYRPGLIGKVLGIDMGTTCHVVEAAIDGGNQLMVQRIYEIDYKEFDVRFKRIVDEVNPIAMVIDSQPYLETVYRSQKRYPNLYGSVYVTSKSMRSFRLMDEEEDKSEALLDERQININRNVALDYLMEDIRAGLIGIDPDMREDHLQLMELHLRDMKRVLMDVQKNQPDTERYQWVKVTGEDHLHHALLYAHIAAKMRVAARPVIQTLPSALLSMKFKINKPLV